MQTDISYQEALICRGILVPFVPAIITPLIEARLRDDRYERRECEGLKKILRPDDRVLELGGGIGITSCVAAHSGAAHVSVVEANPDLIPMMRETHHLNDAQNIEVVNGVVTAHSSDLISFYLRKNFWGASMNADDFPYNRMVQVPGLPIQPLLDKVRPSVIVMDIEGGELGLLDHADLSSARSIIIEFHPKLYGEAGAQAIRDVLERAGFVRDETVRLKRPVQTYNRP